MSSGENSAPFRNKGPWWTPKAVSWNLVTLEEMQQTRGGWNHTQLQPCLPSTQFLTGLKWLICCSICPPEGGLNPPARASTIFYNAQPIQSKFIRDDKNQVTKNQEKNRGEGRQQKDLKLGVIRKGPILI